jgi:DUF1365 family protein
VRRAPGTIYSAEVRHRRNRVRPRTFRYRTCYWLIDVDEPPHLPAALRPFAQFLPSDHLGDPGGTLGANIRTYLAEHGVVADRIELLTCPRTLGHVFNPLSVWYCYRDGEQVAVVAEVHNTYRGRHAYLLRPDDAGRATVDKDFYVSPFLPMGGQYLMRTPPPGAGLSVSIALRQDGTTPFVATLTGTGRAIAPMSVLGALLRVPLVTLRTVALIRWQGVRLWLLGVPVQRRPADATGDERTPRGDVGDGGYVGDRAASGCPAA